ncbi:PEPxxWA-CTERM sorting domain-containing protein [Sphingomonas sp. LR60]
MGLKILAGLAAVALAVPASAGTLVVGGDTTSTFSLDVSPSFGGNPGNRAFYANILGDAKRVLISERTYIVPGYPSFANRNLINFYDSIGGVSVSQTANAISSDMLQGIGLLVLQFPNAAFTSSETMAIGNFVRAGGTLLLTGEASIISPVFPAPDPAPGVVSNTIVNDLLAGLGSSIRLGNDTIGCCGTLTAEGNDIASTPLTKGVDNFKYGAVTSVSGGTALVYAPTDFRRTSVLPFFASETLIAGAVPEPATWAMMILGFGLIGGALRSRRRGVATA